MPERLRLLSATALMHWDQAHDTCDTQVANVGMTHLRFLQDQGK